MAVPIVKSEAIEELLSSLLGRSRIDSIRENTCAWCGKPAREFKDELSRREFSISGFCQQCQDEMFGEELRVQCLYVLNNMTHWIGTVAKEVRKTLKDYAGVK